MTGRKIATAAALIAAGVIAGRISLWLPTVLHASAAPVAAAPISAAPVSAAHRAAVDADPYALVADVRAALASASDPARALESVEARWRGQPVRWRVLVPRALCRRADDCHAVPFDHASARGRALAPIVEGWLPRLRLDAAAMARLDACGDSCTVDVDGTVAEITASAELPTAVTVDVATITAATPPRPTERWMR